MLEDRARCGVASGILVPWGPSVEGEISSGSEGASENESDNRNEVCMRRGCLLPARSENEYFIIGAGFSESGRGPLDGGTSETDQDCPKVWGYTRNQRDVMMGPLDSNRTNREAHI